MAVVLYGIPNCDTVKKARTWLDANAIPYAFHDFKKAGISTNLLRTWLAQTEWNVLLNRKGTTWRSLSDEQKVSVSDAQSAAAIMLESTSLIKRPVLSVDGRIHVGFTPENYHEFFRTNV